MHPQISNIKRIRCWNCPSPHYCRHNRNLRLIHHLGKQRSCAGNIHTAASQEKGTFCLSKHLNRPFQLSNMDMRIRFVPPDIYFFRIFIASQLSHYILRKVYQYRPRSSASRNVESLFQNPPQILSSSHGYSVLRNASGNTDNVYFLKGIVSNQMPCHLPGKADKRYAVIISCRKSGYQIGCSRSACHQTDPYFPGRSCISICFMYQRNFLTRKNHLRVILLIQFITDIDRTGSGIAKNGIYPFFFQCLYQ